MCGGETTFNYVVRISTFFYLFPHLVIGAGCAPCYEKCFQPLKIFLKFCFRFSDDYVKEKVIMGRFSTEPSANSIKTSSDDVFHLPHDFICSFSCLLSYGAQVFSLFLIFSVHIFKGKCMGKIFSRSRIMKTDWL